MKNKAILKITCVLLAVVLAVPVSYAWFSDTLRNSADIESYVHKSYFESGDGTSANQYRTYDPNGDPVIGTDPATGEPYEDDEGCAFEIKYPVQLYYLAWLQYLGYFNRVGEGETNVATVYFYLSADLDMTGWILPPVGTTQYPFVGNFDGNGHTISNLTVQNVDGSGDNAMSDNPLENESVSNAEIIGFFGVVGSLTSDGKVSADLEGANSLTHGNYNYSSITNEIKNFTINGVTIKTETNNALIGAAAGYVNGTVQNVGVANTDLVVKNPTAVLNGADYTGNISDYALVGYCRDPYKYVLNVSRLTLAAPEETDNIIYKNVQGEGAGFGGSIDMKTMHGRLTNVAAQGVVDHDYVIAETIKVDLHTGTKKTISQTTAKASTNTTYYNRGVNSNGNVVNTYSQQNDNNNGYDYYRYLYYQSETAGSYYIQNDVGDFMCLYGENAQYTKTLTTLTYLDEFHDGFKIKNGSTYLNVTRNGNNVVLSTGTDSDAATVWALDDSGHLNALVEFDSSVTTYYLNANTTSGALSVSTTGSTVWTKTGDASGTLTYSNGRTWYLVYDSGWKCLPFAQSFTVSNGTNYLGRSDTGALVGGAANAAHWMLENNRLITYADGAVKYLNADSAGSLTIGSSATTTSWAENNGVFSCTVSGSTWYLQWTGSTWEMFPETTSYLIYSGSNYFGVTNNDLSLTTQPNAVRWVADGSKLYTPINGTKYYLVGSTDGSGDLSLSATRSNGTDWTYTIAGGTMSYEGNGKTWYLYAVGGEWRAYPAANVTTISQNGTYLGVTNATTVGTLAAAWSLDGGNITTFYNGATRYLVTNGTSVTLANSASTVWTVNGNNTITNDAGWYLIYDNGWKCYPSLSYVTITDGTNYMVRNGNSISNTTMSADATRWFADGSKLYAVDGANTYYLRGNGAALSANASANASGYAYDFAYDSTNKRFTYTSGNTYYVVYNGNWVGSTSYVGSGPISVSSGNTTRYLNRNGTTGVTQATTSSTNWTFDSVTGKIYTVNGNTTYYLRGVLAATQTRSTTNLALTTNANDSGTTWDFSNGNLSCTIQVDNADVTYYLTLENNTIKLMDTSKNHFIVNPTSQNTRYYLSFSSSATVDNSVTDANNATLWSSSANLGSSATTSTVSTIINNTTYYLKIPTSSNSAVTATTASSILNYYYQSYPTFYVSQGNNNYFINYYGGWVGYSGYDNYARMTLTNVSFTPATVTISGVSYSTEEQAATIIAANTIDTLSALSNLTLSVQNGFTQTMGTIEEPTSHMFENEQRQTYTKTVETNVRSGHPSYVPLAAESTSPFSTKSVNTGYIVSGANITHSQEYQRISGDIRISRYNMAYIYRSLTTGTSQPNNFTYNNTYDSRLEVLTGMSNGTYTGFYRVSDDKNKSNGTVNTSLSGFTKVDYKTLGLKRYEDARASISDTFLNQNSIYGLHFMDAQITKTRLVTIPVATIEGEEIKNYQVPEDSIDFRVKRRGFITVFAGTYFTGNDAFFSLHEIQRYKENDAEVLAHTAKVGDIKEIKEISKIYKAQIGNDFIYEYATSSGGGYSSNAARGAIAFDMSLMTNPSSSNWVDNAVYYFEIPVNGGEYALGSVSGKTGAYLFYLDIAANAGSAEDKERRTVAEQFTEVTYNVTLPRGVQLLDADGAYNTVAYYETATFELESGFSGTFPMLREDNEVSYTDTSTTELTYIGGALTVEGGGDDYVFTPDGYTVRFVEHVLDYGLATHNYDHFLVETVDTYNASGTRTGRTVNVYASIANDEANAAATVNEDSLDHIITFTYNPSGHDDITMRVVRAASEGGFNIAFDQTITVISTTISSDNTDVHVNFGDNTASVLITATKAIPLENRQVPAVTFDNSGNEKNEYFGSVVGADLVSFQTYFEGSSSSASLSVSTAITMASLERGTAAQDKTLGYAITLTPSGASGSVTGYATKHLTSYSYTTKTFDDDPATAIEDSGTVTVSVNADNAVTINGTNIGTSVTQLTISGS